ncbi:hypothetical protein Cni_G29483 [Canna indica]|uniref:Uncharacterized protein n=1 Tax=Canna indica TaxID=4628 RepID=A0AAQ3L8G4_9LILI|nr:hypothetical protein Cni_G29483 [Canna indica]
MSSLVDIWTDEFARLREKSDGSNPKPPATSAAAQQRGDGTGTAEPTPRNKDAEKGCRRENFSETAVFMLMDRFTPIHVRKIQLYLAYGGHWVDGNYNGGDLSMWGM